MRYMQRLSSSISLGWNHSKAKKLNCTSTKSTSCSFFFCPIYSHFFLDSGQSVETQSHSITFPSILYSVASLFVPIPGPNKLIGWQKTSGRTKRIFGGSWCAYKFFLSSLPAGYNAHFRKDTRYTVIDAPTYCPCSLTQWNRCRHSQKCNQQWWAHVANITFKETDSTYDRQK